METRFGEYTCPYCESKNWDDLTLNNFECGFCGEKFSWLEVDWNSGDGLTEDERNTFSDCVEDALLKEAFQMVFIGGEPDEFRPYREATLNEEDKLPF